jgi:hypothetical protein
VRRVVHGHRLSHHADAAGEDDDAYNAKTAVEPEIDVIVAATLTNIDLDVRHLPSLVAKVRVLRDTEAGYFSDENAREDGTGLDLLIADGRDDPEGSNCSSAAGGFSQ